MKRISFLSLIAAILLLSSCDITREVTINEDGSGKINSTIDMSSMIGLAKMSGQGGEGMEAMGEKNIDTTIAMDQLVDSLSGLTAEEKQLAKKGTLAFTMNMEEEKFITKMLFPFANAEELNKLNKLSGKAMQETIKKQMGGAKEKAGEGFPDEGMPEGSVDDYFTTTYSNGLIEKKLIAEKYADIGSDKGMDAMKEMSGQGLPMSTKLIFNLPRPVKKTEGKNITLSEDKKKVTIVEPIDDFFSDGKSLEFRIEY